VLQAGQVAPERLIAGEVRAEGEQCRHNGSGGEHGGELQAPLRDEQRQAREREQRRCPAEEDEALDPVPYVPRDEVGSLGGVALDLGERAAAGAGRSPDGNGVHEQSRANGERRGAGGEGERASPSEGVEEEERDRSERKVYLPRQRNRRQCGGGDPEPSRRAAQPPFPREQREREQHRDPGEQVPGAGLPGKVGSEAEGEPARERGAAPHSQLAQPQGAEAAGTEEGEENEHVPRGDRAERALQRPVRKAERPAGEAHAGLDERLKAVRIAPRLPPMLELVADEPELVAGLQVVARGGRAVSGPALGHEGRVQVPDPGPCRPETCPEVERAGERYNACAAASSSSKSGTSPAS
jgi:hypothetical protein